MSIQGGGPFPAEVLAALTGSPTVGTWDTIVPLLTVDEAGFPHVCLLSRSELEATEEEVLAAVGSRVTTENLRRAGQATLLVVDGDASIYCKMAINRTDDGEPGLLGVAFRLISMKRDSIGIPLQPPRFLVAEGLPDSENWEASSRLLARLAATPSRIQ